jgi:integrase
MAKSKPNRVKLSQAAVAKLPVPEDGREWYFDAKLSGFGVCCWASGAKTFYLTRKLAGRKERVKLGKFGDVTEGQARQAAVRMAGQIAAGVNPADERRRARGETTLTDLWAVYFEKHAKARCRGWKEQERVWKANISRLGNRCLSKVSRAAVRDWHAAIGKEAPYQANRALAILSSMFTFAIGEGFDGENPCKGIRRFQEISRERILAADELVGLFKALCEEAEPWADFFPVLLFTGARIGNVRTMRWADLELQRGLWRVPGEDAKAGEPLVVILMAPVIVVLRRRLAARAALPPDKQSEYVFPGRLGGCVGYPQTPWERITERAGIKGLRPHDLRRSLASWASTKGGDFYAIGKALGHKDANSTAVYARPGLSAIRAVVGLGTGAMLAVLNPAGVPLAGEAEIAAAVRRADLPQNVRVAILSLLGPTGEPVVETRPALPILPPSPAEAPAAPPAEAPPASGPPAVADKKT